MSDDVRERALAQITLIGQIQALNEELIEQLADAEHRGWADWMKWLLEEKAEPLTIGGRMLSRPYVEALLKQAHTSYADLSPEEQESDRNEVRKIMPLIFAYAAAYNRLVNDITTSQPAPAVLDETVAPQEGDQIPQPRLQAIANAGFQARATLARRGFDQPHFVTLADDGFYSVLAVPEQHQRITDICFANRHIDLLAQRDRDWIERARARQASVTTPQEM